MTSGSVVSSHNPLHCVLVQVQRWPSQLERGGAMAGMLNCCITAVCTRRVGDSWVRGFWRICIWMITIFKKKGTSFMLCGVVPSHSFSATTPTTFPGRNPPTLSNTQLRKLNSGTKTTFPPCCVFLCRFTKGLNVLTEIRRNPSRCTNFFLDSGLKVAKTIF